MFLALLKKDFRLIFSNPVLISIITVLPILIILIFSLTMRSYMDGDYGTFDDCRILYYEDSPSAEMLEQFDSVSVQISEKTGAVFEKTDDYESAKKQVESSEAAAVIKISHDGMEYFRSSFNEPYGGDIIRSLFVQMTETPVISATDVRMIELNLEKPDSEVYYTFLGMVFAIMFMGSFIANTYGKDFSAGTLDRMYLSRAGIIKVLASKFISAFICGIIQMVITLPIATVIFDISWNNHPLLILTVLTTILVFSLSVGTVVGIVIRNETLSYLTFCQFVLFSSYLGGAVTPIYLLKKIPVIQHLIKLSPVYWANESIISLYNGIADSKTWNCITALLLISAVMITFNLVISSKTTQLKIRRLILLRKGA